jgi:ribulose-phosphate 3-epimerase
MDGHFVPNISYGPSIVEAAGSCTKAFLDVHLMIENPDNFIETFVDAGADQLTVHQETCPHLHRTIQNIHQQGITAGVAINPATPLMTIEPVLNMVDLVLVMSVNPGFGGQSFIENTYKKVRQLKEIITRNNANTIIEVDGGVTDQNASQLVDAGADALVAGSFVFKSEDPLKTIRNLNAQVNK